MEHCNDYLYSINTLLAYNINEYYYKGNHYVWCAPKFNENRNPPSSNPMEIVYSLNNDIINGDRHSPKIEQNRIGLLKGVEAKYSAKEIDDLTKDELQYIINNADISHFKPVIYVINRPTVEKNLIKVSATMTASFFSQEYIIEKLKTNQFDIINLKQ